METENTEDNNHTDDSDKTEDSGGRPLGYWLRTVDGYITREFARAFDGEGVTRRDWMALNAVAGDVKVPGFAERLARKGKRLRGLEQRGWVEETGDGSWILTVEGRAAKERLGGLVDDIRSRVAGAVSPEDYATTITSLEAIARELGWDENERTPWPGFGRRFGGGFGPGFGSRSFGPDLRPGFGPREFGRGFGPGFGRGFGPGFGPDEQERLAEHFAEHFSHHRGHHDHEGDSNGHGYGHDRGHAHGHGHRNGHGHSRHGDPRHDTQSAYERGFDAGFTRGRADS